MPHPLDAGDMESVIFGFPRQFAAGLNAAEEALAAANKEGQLPAGPFDGVLLAGMGGSWMCGALVREAGLAAAPIHVHRDYGLPSPLHFKRPLVVASSYSGNTRETISAYEQAREEGLPLVAISRAGELEELCRQDGTPWFPIPADPPDMQPRNATGYTVAILARLLAEVGLGAEGAVDALRALEKPLSEFAGPARERAAALLPELREATPVVYSSPMYATVAHIFKIKFNEHAKTPAFWNVFSELNHNEMVGWTLRRGPFHLILLRDEDDRPCILKRMELSREVLGEHGVPSTVVSIEGESLLEKMFRTLMIADWTAYELALLNGFDPSPVDMVEDFKRRLKALDQEC